MARPLSGGRWLAMVAFLGVAGWLAVIGAVVILHWLAKLIGLV